MLFHELAAFDVDHRHLAWPWVAIAPNTNRIAFATADDRIDAREFVDGARLEPRGSFTLPAGLHLPTDKAPADGNREAQRGLYAFGLSPDGLLLAIIGQVDGVHVVVTLSHEGEVARTTLEHMGRAISFDRTGKRIWIAAVSKSESVLVVLEARTHASVRTLRYPPFPSAAVHELYIHPADDAVLHVAATGDEGTFARVAGWAGGPPEALKTELDAGGIAAGFVGFSRDGARVHFAESDELRTHAWPTLFELSSVPLADAFQSGYSGAVLGDRIYVDGIHVDDEEDAVMLFDRSGILGAMLRPPFPLGMWAGRLGGDVIVTVEHVRSTDGEGRTARGRIYRIPAPLS